MLLRRALQSVLAQSRPPDELIVVVDEAPDGGSADADCALSFAEDLARNRTQLSVLFSGARGPAAARNRGARAAFGTWLAFLDSDDTWSAEKLALQLEHLRRRPHLHGCQTLELWVRNNRVIGQPERLRPRPGRFLRDSFSTCLIACSAVMIRRDTFLLLGGFDESYQVCEDFELWLRYLEQHAMGLVPLPLTQKYAGDWPQQSRSRPMLDALRVRAILAAVDRSRLSAEERNAARSACTEKFSILQRGAKRHGSGGRIEELKDEILRRFPDSL